MILTQNACNMFTRGKKEGGGSYRKCMKCYQGWGGGVYLICILFQHAVRLDHFEGENNNKKKKLWMSVALILGQWH